MARTLKGLIAEHGITAEADYTGEHTEEYQSTYGKGTYRQRDWTVVLKLGRKRLTVPFHTGEGLNDVTAYDVLYCLLSDASGVEYDSFEAWADSYGYDTDSRKAEQTYKLVVAQTAKLRRFLGDLFETFTGSELD